MPTSTLTQERIDWILGQVKRVGETYRKPDGSDPNQWNQQGQRRRFGGAYPRDLGARRRDQILTRQMREMVKLGHLEIVPGLHNPGFVIAKRDEVKSE